MPPMHLQAFWIRRRLGCTSAMPVDVVSFGRSGAFPRRPDPRHLCSVASSSPDPCVFVAVLWLLLAARRLHHHWCPAPRASPALPRRIRPLLHRWCRIRVSQSPPSPLAYSLPAAPNIARCSTAPSPWIGPSLCASSRALFLPPMPPRLELSCPPPLYWIELERDGGRVAACVLLSVEFFCRLFVGEGSCWN